MYWIALTALTVATVFDLRTREIPDAIPIVLLAAALAAKALGLHPVPWQGIALGAGCAFAVSTALFALGGLGGGDVKLLTAVGAALGGKALLPFAFATTIIGGVFALAQRARRGRDDVELAYAPVMLAGLLALLPLVWMSR